MCDVSCMLYARRRVLILNIPIPEPGSVCRFLAQPIGEGTSHGVGTFPKALSGVLQHSYLRVCHAIAVTSCSSLLISLRLDTEECLTPCMNNQQSTPF